MRSEFAQNIALCPDYKEEMHTSKCQNSIEVGSSFRDITRRTVRRHSPSCKYGINGLLRVILYAGFKIPPMANA